MRLLLHARDAIVDRQCLERPDPGLLAGVVGDERSDEACLQGHLAAREAFAAASLKPLVGVVSLIRPGPAEAPLHDFGPDPGDHGGIDGLPQRVAEFILVAEPEGTPDLGSDRAVFKRDRILARPDAAL